MEFMRVMRRSIILLVALLPLMGALGTVPAEARLGGGHSFGSRGSFSFSSPRSTGLAPGAAPFERSQAPTGGGYGRPSMGMGGGFNRRPFMSGLLGGFIGAGIFGLLFGGGFMHMGLGFGGLFGVLLQLIILFFIVRWLMRRFLGGRTGGIASARRTSAFAPPAQPGAGVAPLQITPADQQAFAQCLGLRAAGLGGGRSQRHRPGGDTRDDGLFP